MDKLRRNQKITDTYTEAFQRDVVALLYRDKGFCTQYYSRVKGKHFSSVVYKNLFEVLYIFFYKYHRIPTKDEAANQIHKLFSNNSQKAIGTAHLETLDKLFELDMPDKEYMKEDLTDFIQKAEFSALVADSVENFKTIDLIEIKKSMQDICAINLEDEDLGIENKSFLDILLEDDDVSETAKRTSFSSIDKSFGGGLQSGELAVFMAPSNRGKTSVLINIGRGFLVTGCNVLHISLEMSDKLVAKKYLSSMVDMTSYQLNDLRTLKFVSKTLNDLSLYTDKNLRIKYMDGDRYTLEDIGSYIERLKEVGFETDVLILDYADLLKSRGKHKERRHELNEIYVGLRRMGNEMGFPVVTVTQTNRSGERVDYTTDDTVGFLPKPLNMSHVGEDWQKMATADYVIGLRRPVKTDQLKNPDDRLLIMDVLKSRNAERDIALQFRSNWAKCTLDEVEPGEIDTSELVSELSSKKKLI